MSPVPEAPRPVLADSALRDAVLHASEVGTTDEPVHLHLPQGSYRLVSPGADPAADLLAAAEAGRALRLDVLDAQGRPGVLVLTPGVVPVVVTRDPGGLSGALDLPASQVPMSHPQYRPPSG